MTIYMPDLIDENVWTTLFLTEAIRQLYSINGKNTTERPYSMVRLGIEMGAEKNAH